MTRSATQIIKAQIKVILSCQQSPDPILRSIYRDYKWSNITIAKAYQEVTQRLIDLGY